MDTELKARWVAALRSGKYTQGKACLRSADNKFCCLGVLADIMPGRVWSDTPNTRSTVQPAYEVTLGDEERIYSTELSRSIVLEQSVLIDMNDGQETVHGKFRGGKKFKAIAAYIEANL